MSTYSITEQLYEGAHSLVYRAVRDSDNQRVILKLLKEAYPSPRLIAWFRREYEILRSLDLPGVVKVYRLAPVRELPNFALHDPDSQTSTAPLQIPHGWIMELEDFGADSLKRLALAGQFALPDLLKLAISITDILGQIHQQHIIHKDINPANIVLNLDTCQVKLIDFGVATRLSQETSTFRNPNILEGTLPYISPEQTGRVNRPIDYRSDFYSLGVTLYELFTGRLPFESDDPLEWIHCHIARTPPHPQEFAQSRYDVPQQIVQAISAVILKLMAKNSEDRYQSVYGLRADLERIRLLVQQCAAASEQAASALGAQLASFRPGQADRAERFQIPQKLYGREQEVATLLHVFERVSQGSCELMLVTGQAGVGKSALVQEIYKSITLRNGQYIAGKFDQFQRNIPYSAFIQAFRSLIRHILSESEASIATWRARLQEAFGANGQVILDVIPEVELIVGPQPPVAELTPVQSQNRFHLVFQQFINVLTSSDHPLVLFLDDMQWADGASLKLIDLLITIHDTHNLLLIGAYRDNEVGGGHPLKLMLDMLGNERGADVRERIAFLHLTPLTTADVNHLISETFHCEHAQAEPLAELVLAKTGGNPFFLREFLHTLVAEQAITFHAESGWQWDMQHIQSLPMTDNVADLISHKTRRLSVPTQRMLHLAACIGNSFYLTTLAAVADRSVAQTARDLDQAVAEGLIVAPGDTHDVMTLDIEEGLADTITAEYRFAHDRIQQTAYLALPESERHIVHWRIGHILLRYAGELTTIHRSNGTSAPLQELTPAQEEYLFAITNHLNQGRFAKLDTGDLGSTDGTFSLTAPQPRSFAQQIARFNLLAGKKAKDSAAYEPAFRYFATGRDILYQFAASEADSPGKTGETNKQFPSFWQTAYDLTLALHVEAAEAAALSGRFAEMEELFAQVLANTRTLLDKVKVYEIKIQAQLTQNNVTEAVETGLEILHMLGVTFPRKPNRLHILSALLRVRFALFGKRIEAIANLPEMTDPARLAAIRILSSILSPAFIAKPLLFPLIILKQVSMSVNYGNTAFAAYAYAGYGILLCSATGEIESGYRFGQLALQLVDTFQSSEVRAKTLMAVAYFIYHNKKHFVQARALLPEVYQVGLEHGDFESAGYAAFMAPSYAYFAGKELSAVEQEIARYAHGVTQMNNQTAANYLSLYWQCVLNLLGNPAEPWMLHGSRYEENTMLVTHRQANDGTALFLYHFHKLLLCVLFQQYEQAIVHADLAGAYVDSAVGLPPAAIYPFYDSLARLAGLRPAPRKDTEKDTDYSSPIWSSDQASMSGFNNVSFDAGFLKKSAFRRVAKNQKKLRRLAKHAPMNYRHKYVLVEAECARIQGRDGDAFLHYEQALALAQKHGFVHEEALAHELTARFYLARGNQEIAALLLRKAHYGYQQWGATAKVHQLETTYPFLKDEATSDAMVRDLATSSYSVQSLSTTFDLTSVIKASQAISGEIVLDTLRATMMDILLENAGAERGVLLFNREGTWKVEATSGTIHQQRKPAAGTTRGYPLSLVNYAAHTRECIVLVNAINEGNFTRDEYIQRHQTRSALCLPLLYQSKLMGVLYLENNLTTGAFTEDRVEILQLLSSQVVISIENANLYAHLEEMVEARTDELRQAYQTVKQLNDRLRDELNLAQRIQRSLIPPPTPNWAYLEVVCMNSPAREVGGDLYAYHTFKLPLPPECEGWYGIAVGDVSGKGMPAALLMAVSLASFRSIVAQGLSPGALLAYLDDALVHYTRTTRQNCAMVYMEITTIDRNETTQASQDTETAQTIECTETAQMSEDADVAQTVDLDETAIVHATPTSCFSATLRVANAGCISPLIKRADGAIEWVEVGGMPLGVGMGSTFGYEEVSLDIAKGDMIILVSDGVVEANNAAGEMFGFERLEQVVASGPHTNALALLAHIRQALEGFVGRVEPHDDVTIVVTRV